MKPSRRGFLISSAGMITATASGRGDPPAGRDPWMPKLSENVADVSPETLHWLKQLGCRHVVFQGTDKVDADHKGYWTNEDVGRVKKACADAGLVLESMVIPIDFYRQARLGKPGRDQEIDHVCRTIRAAGANGVPLLEWRFWPDFFWDERVGYHAVPGRGGAQLRAFEYQRVKNAPPFPEIGEVDDKEMWDRFLYFAKPIVQAAEKADVRLTMHPNDPPVPVMRGVARIFHHPDGLRRFLKEIPSRASGITFCQGTIAEMGVNVLDEIRYFGELGKIFLVHFRFVKGKVPSYTEVFVDQGDLDPLKAMKAYREVGYTGPIVSDHTPKVEGDTGWGYRGRTFSLGFIRALVHAANAC